MMHGLSSGMDGWMDGWVESNRNTMMDARETRKAGIKKKGNRSVREAAR
jgi:hypothetical protein